MDYRFYIAYLLIDLSCLAYTLVIWFKLSRDIGPEREVKAYRFLLCAYLCFVATNTYWLFGLVKAPEAVIHIFNTANICFVLFTVYAWTNYAELIIYKRQRTSIKRRLVSFTPLFIFMALTASSFHTEIIYTIVDGDIVNKPAYKLIIATIGVYLVGITAQAALEMRVARSINRRKELHSIILFPLAPFLAGVVDAFVPNMPVMVPTMFFSIHLVFMNMQESKIFHDALTGLNNRRRADAYINEILEDAKVEPFYLYMTDVDKFKNINDTYSHIEGDKALKIIADAIKVNEEYKKYFAARWGGDEFMVIIDEPSNKDPLGFLKMVNKKLEARAKEENLPYSLAISGGYVLCDDPAVRAVDLIKEADEKLYLDKARNSRLQDRA